jgi:putative MFS transporter
MFNELDKRTSPTGNQIKILTAAIIGDALEFFDYFLISFVLAFLIGPWKLTFGQSAIVLMSSGIGAILGAYAWGWLALTEIPTAFVYLGCGFLMTGIVYYSLGIETKGKSIEEIDRELNDGAAVPAQGQMQQA